ncbi:hypothetical protein BOX15_Mlig021107g4 [Macrostomum lignano]|uniref:Uncharacterized protein n=1 Tax=Macrostomum lignano TaxID=282301 RepID=A0A267FD14_9PLAT|nr:hypothetical protein BOX15_Mlig003127g1 [Macrostomum lignano]PAA71658.1 hypothetical protein BOX15_Mlig021107g4 [Macrostomum lignano]
MDIITPAFSKFMKSNGFPIKTHECFCFLPKTLRTLSQSAKMPSLQPFGDFATKQLKMDENQFFIQTDNI